MALSFCGANMTRLSGLRSIMDDVAVAQAGTPGAQWRNLGVGNPALIPEAVAMWQALAEEALADDFTATSCRYGPSRGVSRLVDAIVEYFSSRYGWDLSSENVVVGPGSQMLCFIAAALFAGPGPSGAKPLILPALPDYAGYQSLCVNGADVKGISPKINFLPGRRFEYLLDHDALSTQSDVGLVLLSSPCNPTGRCVDSDDIKALTDIACARDGLVLIDNAYGEPFPRIAETLVPPVWHEKVINCFSISKAGLPGERLGFAIGDRRHISGMVSFIANTSLHAPQPPQIILARALETGKLDELAVSVIKPYYRARRQAVERLLHDILPESIDWRLHVGQGGMFAWLWINEPWFDDGELYQMLKLKKVIVVPGRHFFTESEAMGQHGTQCVRISVTPHESEIRAGLEKFVAALSEMQGVAISRRAGVTV